MENQSTVGANSENSWEFLETDVVLSLLKTDVEKGLSTEEARSRLNVYGYNELASRKRVSPVHILIKQFRNLLLILLLIATIISAFMGELVDAIVILVIVIFVVILGFAQEYRAERALEALKKLLAPTCTVRRDGLEIQIPAKELVPGDIVVLAAGDKVPADMRLVEATNLQVDEAPLTGESLPVLKTVKPLPRGVARSERINMLFFGTTVICGKGKGVVTATGMKTEFGKIAEALSQVEEEKTPLERRMDEIGKKLGFISLILVILILGYETIMSFYLYGALSFNFFFRVLLFAVALAVAAVPEALPAIVTANLAIGMRKMAERNALIRKMHAIETLGSTQVICTDKTGTLTKGEMTVRQVYFAGKCYEVTGVGYDPTGEVLLGGVPISVEERKQITRLARAAILCNDARLEYDESGRRVVKGDTTEGALIVFAEKIDSSLVHLRNVCGRFYEIPFSSERKMMTTMHEFSDTGQIAIAKGAPEIILARCSHHMASESIEPLLESERNRIMSIAEEMASNGMRVLAVAERPLPAEVDVTSASDVERDLIFLGLIGMMDPPRKDAIDAINVAKRIGIRTIMITGDHKLTAVAIARELGIYAEGDLVLTGEELEQIPDEEYEKIVEKVTVYARVSPLHKLKIVEAWKKRNYVVAMTGDGVNDAPALKRADIGIAMGITGTDVAKEASHMVLGDDNFATIIKAVEYGRLIYGNIKKYLTYLLQANLVEIAVIALGVLVVLPLFGFSGEGAFPLLAVHILYINLATDGLPALALSFSPGDPDLMTLPPRPKNEPVFTRDVKLFLLRALIIETPVLLLGFLAALHLGVDAARSRMFLMFIAIELVIALSCRSLTFPISKVKPHRLLMFTVIWEIILIVILLQIPVTREALHLVPPSIEDIAWVIGGAIIVLLSMELLKHVLSHYRNKKKLNPYEAAS
ncbi:MAG: cation-translocating P-type ATPase [Methanomassiliicoccales archaeon]|nr:cation-translocating P-type ATPase [Methanomassiliicoccales archaeon]